MQSQQGTPHGSPEVSRVSNEPPSFVALNDATQEETDTSIADCLRAWKLGEIPREHFHRNLKVFLVGISVLVAQIMVVSFMLKPIPGGKGHTPAMKEQIVSYPRAAVVDATPSRPRELWCTYEPGHEGYMLWDVPVEFCNAVLYCCVDLSHRGIRYLRPDVDEGHSGIDLFYTLREKRPTTALYALLGDGQQTTAAFQEKLAGVDIPTLIETVRLWLRSKHLQGLVFYHHRHEKPLRGDNTYRDYYKDFVYQLGRDDLFVSAVVPFYTEYPGGGFSIAQFVNLSLSHLVLKSHNLGELPPHRAACPSPFTSKEEHRRTLSSFFRDVRHAYVNFNQDYAGRLLFSISLLAAQYRLTDPMRFTELSPAWKLDDPAFYSTMCSLTKRMGFVNLTSTDDTDCLIVHKGVKWFSGFGPESTRVFRVTSGYAGVVLFGMHSDDYRGVCGQPHPLVRHVHSALRIFG
ncbi:uncharacterized protein LOC135396026 [Ornithodoros turicata]|uniref:uncharacterized protein LOC135396026 n=1 Tax=Ornithodoros turicata TaxID=34597 RepID=UPI003138CB21